MASTLIQGDASAALGRRAVPVWVSLGAIVVASASARFLLARRIEAPWIMVDELVYSELAKSLAAGDGFSIRGVSSPAYGFVYPLLISPAYLVESPVLAYQIVKAINAVLVSLAAVPAYFLARRVLASSLSLLAALLSLAIPSLLYAGEVMTENAFYPLFLCVVLALVMVLERPTFGRQFAVLALVGVAYLTRVQAIAFLPAIAIAPLLVSRGAWRSYRVLYGTLVGVVIVSGGVQLLRGESPLGLLGAHSAAAEQDLEAFEIARWLLYHVAELDLYLGVVPFAATLLVFALWRRVPRRLRPFLATVATVSVAFIFVVSAFASIPSVSRIEERNLFYLAPLALIGLLVWIDHGLPRPKLAVGAAAFLAAVLPAAIPHEQTTDAANRSEALMLLPFQGRAGVLVFTICASLAFVLTPRRYGLLLPLGALLFFAAVHPSIVSEMTTASRSARSEGTAASDRRWIDHAVRGAGPVAVLWTGRGSPQAIWQNEFFNRSVGTVYYDAVPMVGGLPATQITVDEATGLFYDPAGVLILEPSFLLSDASVNPDGVLFATDSRALHLYRLQGPLQLAEIVTGLYPKDTWSGPTVTYRRSKCLGGSLTVVLGSDPGVFDRESTVTVRNDRFSFVVPPDNGRHPFTFPLRSSENTCTATFDVSPTAVPGGSDPRELGLHFYDFDYRP